MAVMGRLLGATVLAGMISAALASAQLWLATWTRVYYPAQAFHPSDRWYGNPAWPTQLIVLVWCVSSAVLVGTAAANPLVRQTWWRR